MLARCLDINTPTKEWVTLNFSHLPFALLKDNVITNAKIVAAPSCPRCTSGKIACENYDCADGIDTVTSSTCDYCDGTGEEDCGVCNGAGQALELDWQHAYLVLDPPGQGFSAVFTMSEFEKACTASGFLVLQLTVTPLKPWHPPIKHILVMPASSVEPNIHSEFCYRCTISDYVPWWAQLRARVSKHLPEGDEIREPALHRFADELCTSWRAYFRKTFDLCAKKKTAKKAVTKKKTVAKKAVATKPSTKKKAASKKKPLAVAF